MGRMNGQREQHEHEGGFTLIELLMSIVIVGILAAVAIVGVAGLQEKGQTAACATSLDAAKSATEIYYSITGGSSRRRSPTSRTRRPAIRCSIPRRESSQGATTLVGKDGSWTVTMIPGATTTDRTTYTGCSAAGT